MTTMSFHNTFNRITILFFLTTSNIPNTKLYNTNIIPFYLLLSYDYTL